MPLFSPPTAKLLLRSELVAKISMVLLSPTVHLVPAANPPTVDQVPDEHCWKVVPSMQFHVPGVAHSVPGVWVVFEEEEDAEG